MNVAVVGLGKMGLPIAVQCAASGARVFGIDIDRRLVDGINKGVAPIAGEEGLPERLAKAVSDGSLVATSDFTVIQSVRTVVVLVPLLVDGAGAPDYEALDRATDMIGANLQRGSLVIYETTLPVGTTRSRWRPRLELASGLSEGTDFHVVFSPERVYSGRVFHDLARYPKLIGGLSRAGADLAADFYERIIDFEPRLDLSEPNGVWDLGSAEAAELAKLAETTYRDVNIAFANQIARFADRAQLDVYQVIRAANSQPYSHIHSPGIAVGGHCIPVYPQLYLLNDDQGGVVAAARSVNSGMPEYGVSLLEKIHGSLDDVAVAILGIAYRGGIKESAFSGVFPLVAALRERSARVLVHDPLYTDDEIRAMGFEPYHLGSPVEAVIVQADHQSYSQLCPSDLPGVRSIVDGRRIVEPDSFPGVAFASIGGGSRLAK